MDDYYWRRTKQDKTRYRVYVNMTVVKDTDMDTVAFEEFSVMARLFELEHLNPAANVSELWNAMLYEIRKDLWRQWDIEESQRVNDDNADSALVSGK